MRRNAILQKIVWLCVVMVLAAPAWAGIVNPGFEMTPDFFGWLAGPLPYMESGAFVCQGANGTRVVHLGLKGQFSYIPPPPDGGGPGDWVDSQTGWGTAFLYSGDFVASFDVTGLRFSVWYGNNDPLPAVCKVDFCWERPDLGPGWWSSRTRSVFVYGYTTGHGEMEILQDVQAGTKMWIHVYFQCRPDLGPQPLEESWVQGKPWVEIDDFQLLPEPATLSLLALGGLALLRCRRK